MTRDRAARLIGWGAAGATLVALVAVDVAIGGSTPSLTVLFAISPLVACAVLSPPATAVVAVATLAAAVASGWWNGNADTAQQWIRVLDVLLISGAGVAISAVRVRREVRYDELTRIAEAAQRAILPILPPVAGDVAIAAHYQSAAVGALVGGDLYDCYHHGALCRIVIGDVRGKGISGVEQAARVIRAFRQAAARSATLVEVVQDMDDYLTPFFEEEEFVTAVVVEVVTGSAELSVVVAGHPPPLLLDAGGALRTLDPPVGIPMGTGLPGSWTSANVPWRPRERLLLYTDGLSEARDEHGAFLPLERLARPLSDPTPHVALERVLETVRDYVPHAELGDDLAVVLLQRTRR